MQNPSNNIKFERLPEGLSQNTVTSIFQDQKGYMWFGTRSGLNRYDGLNYKSYEYAYDEPSGLSNSYISCIYEDSKNNLWIGTYGGGLNLYNRRIDQFEHFVSEEGNLSSLSDNSINSIFEDDNGNLWVGTVNGGLNKFDPKSKSFRSFKHQEGNANSLPDDYVTTIIAYRHGHLLIGTWGGGISIFDPVNEVFNNYSNNEGDKHSISSNIIRSAHQGKNNKIWLGTMEGVNLVVTDKDGNISFKRYTNDPSNQNSLIHNAVLSLLEDRQNRLWVGTENGGLSVLDIESGIFKNYKFDPGDNHSISSNSIWSLYEDHVGTIWLGTFNRGLNKVDRYHEKFDHYYQNPYKKSTLSNNTVSSFAEDRDGNIWIGTDGGGLNYYNKKTGSYKIFKHNPDDPNSISSNAVVSVLTDSKYNTWIGTYNGGLNLLKNKNGSFVNFQNSPEQPEGIGGNNVFSIIEDKNGLLWLGIFRNGVDIFDPNTNTFTHLVNDPNDGNSLSNNMVRTLFQDKNGVIWVGTEGAGINKIVYKDPDHISITRYQHNSKDSSTISSDIVLSIFEDSNNNLWIGTREGLNLMNRKTGTFSVYRKSDGLPNNAINGILEENNNVLWISTNKGLSRFNIKYKTFKNYTTVDGLQANEFVKGAFMKSKAGKLYFGGINGYNVFHAESVRENPNTPPVYITDFKIFDKPISPEHTESALESHISEMESIELPHDENVFSFEFSALNYSQASRNQFAYQLKGYDRDWQYVGTRRIAYYKRVPPGEYEFKVIASNNDGIWNEEGASLKLTIHPPWWKTPLAYTLYTLAVISILIGARQNIIRRERLKSDLKLEQLELNKMHEVDQVKSRFFANISHEFRTPLTLILGPLRQFYDGSFDGDHKHQFKVMIRNAERLLNLINQLLDLSKLGAGSMKLRVEQRDIIKTLKPLISSFKSFADKQHIDYLYEFYEGEVYTYFDYEKLEQVIINLLSNAFKYTPENETVKFSAHPIKIGGKNSHNGFSHIEIKVQDTGIGISKSEIAHIFDRFYQVDGHHSNIQKGTGIGLSITKELVELHKGQITVKSVEDQGTTFTIKLPLGKEHFDADEIIEGPRKTKSNEDSSVAINSAFESSVGSKPQKTEVSSNEEGFNSLPIILVVEDNVDLRDYICEYLDTNYRVLEAADGKAGLQMALKHIPDLIISDLMMPKLNGLELCKKIKEDEKTSHIPFMMITAKASSEDKLDGYESGADHYITKPFNSKLLELHIRNIIKSREVLKGQQTHEKKVLQLEPKEVKLTPLDETFLKKALECVEKNMSNSEFSVESFNKEMGLSRMQSYRKLKALTGQSVNEFIRTIRLKRAAQIIKQNQLTIAEVTYEVGFNDLQYFRHCFKKQFGVNPSEYQNSVEQEKVKTQS